jgi:uncharacterized membrane protein YidH (DUF202 family)
MQLSQGLLEYKTAKAKKQSRIKAWWDTGMPLSVLGIGLLFIWGFYAHKYQFAKDYLTLYIGVTIIGITMMTNAMIERKHFQTNRILLRKRVKNAVLAAGIICIAAYIVYTLVKIFTS